MKTMTKWERIRATMRGEQTDRTPVALWRHFPVQDETPEGLAGATIQFQEAYDWDLIKFTPTGTYGIEDFGAETAWKPNDMGVRTVTQFGVTSPEQWKQLKAKDAAQGYMGRQIKALEITAKHFKGDVPLLQTVFSPLTTARKLAGDRIFADMRMHPQDFKAGLEAITETTIQFTLESLRAGATGIFFATQNANYWVVNDEEYRTFGEAFDLRVLQAARSQAEMIMLHNHGHEVMFELAKRYPVDLVNWHDRITSPSLKEARQKYDLTLVGGVNEWHTLLTGPAAAIQAEVKDAITQAGGRKFIVGPGCVVPGTVPGEHLMAVRRAVET